MSDKELYRQKKQAELDEWQAEVDKYKAKASGVSADIQLEMNKQIEALERKIEEGKAKLAAMGEITGDAWESLKGDIESTWESVKSAFNDSASRFK